MSQNQKATTARASSAEPTAGLAVVPIWLIVVFGALFYWGAMYLEFHGGGFEKDVFEPYKSLEEVTALRPHNPEEEFLAKGKVVFEKTCILCHQANGMGKDGQFPPLDGSEWVQAMGPNRIGRIVMDGLTGPIQLNAGGKTVSLNATMTPWRDTYNDEEIAAVLTYVRRSWGNHAGKITPEQIAPIRAATAVRKKPWTQKDLEEIPVVTPAK